MNKDVIIRKILMEEYSFMEDIMYEAVYHPDPKNPYPKDVIYLPQVRVYWDNWGKGADDHCLVSIVGGKMVGEIRLSASTSDWDSKRLMKMKKIISCC